jgi:hypothetical protein
MSEPFKPFDEELTPEQQRIKQIIDEQNPEFEVVGFAFPQIKLFSLSKVDIVSASLGQIQEVLGQDTQLIEQLKAFSQDLPSADSNQILFDIQVQVRRKNSTEEDSPVFWWFSREKQAVIVKQI